MMNEENPWNSGSPYERFMGRWSRKISPLFLEWLQPGKYLSWLDVGCGTGALSTLIAQKAKASEVLGIDPSNAFIEFARQQATGVPRLHFMVGSADHIDIENDHFHWAVSALALNFFPDPVAGLREMKRTVRPDGMVAVYVWDYAEGMQMLRYFWDVVIDLDPETRKLEGKDRSLICKPDSLMEAFNKAGLNVLDIKGLEAAMIFQNFDDYWLPFLGGAGPGPSYVTSLSPYERKRLQGALRERLPIQKDGTIPLSTRAWAVKAALD